MCCALVAEGRRGPTSSRCFRCYCLELVKTKIPFGKTIAHYLRYGRSTSFVTDSHTHSKLVVTPSLVYWCWPIYSFFFLKIMQGSRVLSGSNALTWGTAPRRTTTCQARNFDPFRRRVAKIRCWEEVKLTNRSWLTAIVESKTPEAPTKKKKQRSTVLLTTENTERRWSFPPESTIFLLRIYNFVRTFHKPLECLL